MIIHLSGDVMVAKDMASSSRSVACCFISCKVLANLDHSFPLGAATVCKMSNILLV